MSEVGRPPPGEGKPVERLIRAGFGAVITRLEQLSERVELLEKALADLNAAAPPSLNSLGYHAPGPAPAGVQPLPGVEPAPIPPNVPVPDPPNPNRHIDPTLVWGSRAGERPARIAPPKPAAPQPPQEPAGADD
jgi:hypothetical protein